MSWMVPEISNCQGKDKHHNKAAEWPAYAKS